MTNENEIQKCDVEDILCQMEILSNLRGLQSALGDERFKTQFPELEGLSGQVSERIAKQDTSLKEALERCGLTPTEEVERETTVETEQYATPA